QTRLEPGPPLEDGGISIDPGQSCWDSSGSHHGRKPGGSVRGILRVFQPRSLAIRYQIPRTMDRQMSCTVLAPGLRIGRCDAWRLLVQPRFCRDVEKDSVWLLTIRQSKPRAMVRGGRICAFLHRVTYPATLLVCTLGTISLPQYLCIYL